MPKKSIIQREKKRQKLVIKYLVKRIALKNEIKHSRSTQQKVNLNRKLQQFPRDSSPVRLRNRCLITGRARGYFKDFGLSRHVLREMAHQGFLPGITKSSW
uniref:Small ribosomal subunit protein uS14c n=1 Tax=Stichococcus bacillaris TaxID=37433 RepID=A0A097KKI5_9CHLO|nr:ribosomal protein S14 [Stichococcus bacillaris]YP_009105089.1 ribosomal protein S14 [Stichococcus bacillaris]AIT93694.1 ribosomal protein S14 [Stichococcus bacillaris]AIT93713.1 ribosomal protein S14 [Stichococcus bacillaris]